MIIKYTAWLPFLTLRSTPGVVTNSVPAVDDGSSPAIPIPTGFPIGNSNQSVAYVSMFEFIKLIAHNNVSVIIL